MNCTAAEIIISNIMTVTESPDLNWGAPRIAAWVSRATTGAVGLAAIIWAVLVVPDFWRQASIGPAASRILVGDLFGAPALEKLAHSADAIGVPTECFPPLLRSIAIIRLRRAETAISDGHRAAIDVRMEHARDTIRSSLSCAPADPFLWFAAFWLENNLTGFRPANIELLRMSYRLGPNEGWIALRRNRIALALYDDLPPDLQRYAVHEFVRLMQSNFITDGADIFLDQGWPVRDALLKEIAGLEQVKIDFFAMLLRGRGYDVPIVVDRAARR